MGPIFPRHSCFIQTREAYKPSCVRNRQTHADRVRGSEAKSRASGVQRLNMAWSKVRDAAGAYLKSRTRKTKQNTAIQRQLPAAREGTVCCMLKVTENINLN